MDAKEGLDRLDEIAQAEYAAGFEKAVDVPEEKLKVRRAARLAGIELKRPFAQPLPINEPSETGALQEWRFKFELLNRDANGSLALDALKGEPSYQLELKIYAELIAQDDPDTKIFDFANFLYNNHSESNWFLAALRAAQPYLCENPDRKVKEPPSPEKQREFWDMAKEAAEDLAKEGLKAAVEPVAHILCEVVPFLAGASSAFTFGFSFLLIHYAKKGYCSAKIQMEIIQTLKWNNDENR